MSFRYIGSKSRVVDQLLPYLGEPGPSSRRFVDLFCGTGAVSAAAAAIGWPVWVNDMLYSAVSMAVARVTTVTQTDFCGLQGYHAALEELNSLQPVEGFIWREYSPASAKFVGLERRYFTEENASRIDAMRERIEEWYVSGATTRLGRTVLIADLLAATNRVANIAGTYGCFLSKWQRQAQNAIVLAPRVFLQKAVAVESTVTDVFGVKVHSDDVVYLDPPYTKRQYASYYHILETITLGDKPVVEGVCGLRPWKNKASPFCYKARALKALIDLIANLDAQVVLLSYSEEGHIDLAVLSEQLSSLGRVDLVPLDSVGRYRPNQVASSNGSHVTEYLLRLQRDTLPKPVGTR